MPTVGAVDSHPLPTRDQLSSDLSLLVGLPPSTLSSLLSAPSASSSSSSSSSSRQPISSSAALISSLPPDPSAGPISSADTQTLARAYVRDLKGPFSGRELEEKEQDLERLGREVDQLRERGEGLGRELQQRGEELSRDLLKD